MIIDPYNFRAVKIVDKQYVARDTVIVETEKPADYQFTPGQYAITKTSRIRQYSFTNSPHDKTLQFLIRRQPEGEVSNWFYNQSNIGEEIYISDPLGQFIIEEPDRNLLIAGGSGIAPFLSMIRYRSDKLSLIYSDHTVEHLCYNDELSQSLGNRYLPIITSDEGRITSQNLPDLSAWRQFYICGSKMFADDLQRLLIDAGVPASDIKRELFTLQ